MSSKEHENLVFTTDIFIAGKKQVCTRYSFTCCFLIVQFNYVLTNKAETLN